MHSLGRWPPLKSGVRPELEVFGGSTENSELPGFLSSLGPVEVSASPFLDPVQRPCPRLLSCRMGLNLLRSAPSKKRKRSVPSSPLPNRNIQSLLPDKELLYGKSCRTWLPGTSRSWGHTCVSDSGGCWVKSGVVVAHEATWERPCHFATIHSGFGM